MIPQVDFDIADSILMVLEGWELLAAKTHQKRGPCEFWRPLVDVLGSFLGGFLMFFFMIFLYFSYLILQDANMS